MSENIGRYNVIFELLTNTKNVDEVEKKVGGLQKTFNSAKVAFAGIVAGAALQSIGQQIFETTAKFQGYESVLKNTLGTQLEADKALNLIKQTAKGTVFSVDELTASYLKFANRGIKLTSAEIVKLADIAASQGKSFDQLTEAVLDAQTGEFERLKEFGIRASKEGDNISFAFKGVTQTIKNTPEAISALITSYGTLQGVQGANITQMETLNGRISNIRDTVDELAVKTGNFLLPIFNFLLDAVVSLVAGLGTFIDVLISIPKFISDNAFAFKALAVAIISFNIPLIISTTALLSNIVATKAKAAADFFLAQKTGLLTRAQWLLNAAFAANPIGFIIGAVALLVAGFVLLYNRSETVRNIFSGIANVAKSLVNVFKDVSESITKTFSGGFLNGLKNIGTSIIDGIKKSFSEAFSDLENIINGQDVGNSALRLAKKVLNIMTFGLGSAITEAGKFVIDAFTKGFEDNKEFEAKVNVRLNRGSLGGSDRYKAGLEDAKKAAEKLREQDRAALALRLEDENAALKRQINIRKAYGKETVDLEKAILSNERKILELKKEDKSKILDKINELDVLKIKESLKNESEAIEKKFELQELEARQTIANAEDLANELKRIELNKQIELSELALKNVEKNKPAFIALQNQILRLKAEYDSLFSRDNVDIIDLLPPAQYKTVTKQVDILNKELQTLVTRFNQVSDPRIKAGIKDQIDSIKKDIISFQSPKLNKLTFEAGGFEAIDIEQVLPQDQVAALKNRLSTTQDAIQDLLSQKKNKTLDVGESKLLTKFQDDAEKIKQILADLGVSVGESAEDYERELGGILQGVAETIKGAALEVIGSEIEITDRSIDQQEKRVETAEKNAEKGKVKQLQIEEARLAELTAKREKYAQAQRVISQLEITQANAVAAANSIAAIAASFKAGGPAGIISGIATGVALAAQIAIIVSSVRNSFADIPAFKHGVKSFSSKDNGRVTGPGNGTSDSVNAHLSNGERVIDAFRNSRIGDLSNEEITKIVENSKAYPKIATPIILGNHISDNSDIKNEIIEMRKSFESLKIVTKIDQNGFYQGVQKKVANVDRRSKIKR